MKYKLINPPSNKYNAQQQILINRGIDEKDISHYMNLTDDDINPPEALGEELLEKAAAALREAIDGDKDIAIVVDADCDGYTSSAILVNYLYDLNAEYTLNHVYWFLHEGKQHGLTDAMNWIEDIGAELIIVPDGGSNDWEQLKQLHNQNRKVIILDHHETIVPKNFQDAIIINNNAEYEE